LRWWKHYKCPAESKPHDIPSKLGAHLTDTTTSDEAWFYTLGGERIGPVTVDKLRELFTDQTIDGDTPIWRKGMTNWEPARTTEFGVQLTDVPPPVAARHIDNGLV
jgi:hypothetical protein